ncbi:MAG: hypothetical protein ACE15F_15310 [bacterium]
MNIERRPDLAVRTGHVGFAGAERRLGPLGFQEAAGKKSGNQPREATGCPIVCDKDMGS